MGMGMMPPDGGMPQQGGMMNPLMAAIGMGAPQQSPEGAVMPAEAPVDNQAAAYVAPSITMPDTLAAALQNANKHLILIARGQEKFDFESTTPQIETMQQLLTSIQEGESEDNAEPDTGR